MRTIARFMDARNTAEGKFLSVLLSVLLVFSFLNVTMFTDYANATDENAPEATVEENQSLDAVDPAADEPEEEALEGEGAPEQEQPESEEPAGEVNEPEKKEAVAATNVDKEADEPGVGLKRIVSRSQNLAVEPNAAAALSADLELTIGDSETLKYSSQSKYNNYRWKVASGGNVVKIANDKGDRSKTGNQYTYSNSVTAIGSGTATVEFQTQGMFGRWTTQYTRTIEVVAPALTGITISGWDTVAEFVTVTLTAKLSPEGAAGRIVWSSDDPSVATVDGRGQVTGVAEGETVIRATVEGTSVAAEHKIVVTRSRASESAEFYYLKTPTSDPASNNGSEWGSKIGDGTVDVSGAQWDGINCFVSDQQNRIVSWPDGFENGVVPRTSNHWDVIFNAFKSTVDGGNVTRDDIESITLVPYKISNNNNGYHVDCQVVVKAKQAATATFYLWDVDDTGYIFKHAVTVRKGNEVSVPSIVRDLPTEKIVGDRTYRLVAWRTNPGLAGSDAVFPYSVQENTNFYAKYVAEYRVDYDLAEGSWEADPQNGYAAGDTVVVASERPQRDGYEFKGWKLSTDGADVASGDTFTMPAQDVTLTAQWEKRSDLSYTINYLQGLHRRRKSDRRSRGGRRADVRGYGDLEPSHH